MKTRYSINVMTISSLLFIAILFLIVLPSHFDVFAADEPLVKILPPSGHLKGWTIDGKISSYTKDTLYTYINGEAELYLPYGFSLLASAVYVKQENPGVALVADIFQMGSALDAFGIFSYYRNPESERIGIGAGGFIDESQLMFYKDRYFVRLSSSGDNPERNIFIFFAEQIARNIPGTSIAPIELAFLKAPNIITGTEKYTAQSVLGYSFFKKGLTADGLLSGRPIRIFVILNTSTKEATDSFNRYFAYLKEKGGKPQLNRDAKGVVTLVGRDPLYKGVLVRRSGKYVFGITGLRSP